MGSEDASASASASKDGENSKKGKVKRAKSMEFLVGGLRNRLGRSKSMQPEGAADARERHRRGGRRSQQQQEEEFYPGQRVRYYHKPMRKWFDHACIVSVHGDGDYTIRYLDTRDGREVEKQTTRDRLEAPLESSSSEEEEDHYSKRQQQQQEQEPRLVNRAKSSDSFPAGYGYQHHQPRPPPSPQQQRSPPERAFSAPSARLSPPPPPPSRQRQQQYTAQAAPPPPKPRSGPAPSASSTAASSLLSFQPNQRVRYYHKQMEQWIDCIVVSAYSEDDYTISYRNMEGEWIEKQTTSERLQLSHHPSSAQQQKQQQQQQQPPPTKKPSPQNPPSQQSTYQDCHYAANSNHPRDSSSNNNYVPSPSIRQPERQRSFDPADAPHPSAAADRQQQQQEQQPRSLRRSQSSQAPRSSSSSFSKFPPKSRVDPPAQSPEAHSSQKDDLDDDDDNNNNRNVGTNSNSNDDVVLRKNQRVRYHHKASGRWIRNAYIVRVHPPQHGEETCYYTIRYKDDEEAEVEKETTRDRLEPDEDHGGDRGGGVDPELPPISPVVASSPPSSSDHQDEQVRESATGSGREEPDHNDHELDPVDEGRTREEQEKEERERREHTKRIILQRQQKREEGAASISQLVKNQRVRYFHKLSQTWYDDAHVVGVHFDDGVDKPYYTIRYLDDKDCGDNDKDCGDKNNLQERQTTSDRLEALDWEEEKSWPILLSKLPKGDV